jgi:hypothetical protein
MIWLLFIFLTGLILAILALAPAASAGLGFLAVLLWVMLTLYLIFYKRDETSEIFQS